MTYKVFKDEKNPEQEMQVYLNKDNRCYITCGDLVGDGYYSGFITLDADDLRELISELQFIKKAIEDAN